MKLKHFFIITVSFNLIVSLILLFAVSFPIILATTVSFLYYIIFSSVFFTVKLVDRINHSHNSQIKG